MNNSKISTAGAVPSKPKTPPPAWSNLPADLCKLDQWVMWKWVWNPKKKDWDKPPLRSDGKPASSTNPLDRMSFYDAKRAFQKGGFDGIGFVFTEESGYVGVDLDDCLDADGVPTGETGKLLEHVTCTYCEVSPSGTGVKAWFRGTKTATRCQRSFPDKTKMEIYDHGRYFTVTGRLFSDDVTTVESCPQELRALEKILEETPSKPAQGKGVFTGTVPPRDGSDEWVLERCRGSQNGAKFNRLWNGDLGDHGGDESAADLALCSILHFFSGDTAQVDRLFRQSGLKRGKWDEKRGSKTYGQLTLEKASQGETADILRGVDPAPAAHRNGKPQENRKGDPSPEELAEIAEAALLSGGQIGPQPEVEFIWPNFIPRGTLGTLDGWGSIGKSSVMAAVTAGIISGGNAILGWNRPKNNVLWISSEEEPEKLRARLVAHGCTEEDINNHFHVLCDFPTGVGDLRRHVRLPDDDWMIRYHVKKLRPELVIMDSLAGLISSKINLNEDQRIREALSPLVVMGRQYNTTFLVIRHHSKASLNRAGPAQSKGAGSVGIGNLGRFVLNLERDPEDTYGKKRLLQCVKANNHEEGWGIRFTLEVKPGFERKGIVCPRWSDSELLPLDYISSHSRKPATRRIEIADRVQELLSNGPRSKAELAAALGRDGVPTTSIYRTLDRMTADKILTTREGKLALSIVETPF